MVQGGRGPIWAAFGRSDYMNARIDPLFCAALATAADRGEADEVVLERLLDGSPAAERWSDCSTLLISLIDSLTRGGIEDRVLVAMHVFESAGAKREQTEAAVRSASNAVERIQQSDEDVVLYLWEVCRLGILLSHLLAVAEQVAGGDPVRWCGGSEPPVHRSRPDTSTQHAPVAQQ